MFNYCIKAQHCTAACHSDAGGIYLKYTQNSGVTKVIKIISIRSATLGLKSGNFFLWIFVAGCFYAEICLMNILIVAATPQEVITTRQYLAEKKYQRKDCSVHILTTGVGLTNTAYSLAKYLSHTKPDLAIQAGIGGSFHPFYQPGSVYVINEEIFGDLGVEEGNEFKDIFDLGIADNSFPFSGKWLMNPHANVLDTIKLKQVRGVSVNEITTNPGRIHYLMEKHNVIIESMEGAAFHYVCLQEHIPFVQLRAVSNFVGERDKSRWLIKEAIEKLNHELIGLIRPLLCH